MSATGDAGFTLIEMLVVLAVLGLIAGLGYPRLQQAVAAQGFRTAGSEVAAQLRLARATALRTGAPVRAAVDVMPDIALSMPPGGIIFFADGSSNGGSAELDRPGQRLRFEVAPATGLFRTATR